MHACLQAALPDTAGAAADGVTQRAPAAYKYSKLHTLVEVSSVAHMLCLALRTLHGLMLALHGLVYAHQAALRAF